MVGEALSLAEKPSHVPLDLVVDFDLWDLPGAADDVQLAMLGVRDASPEIFWTPRNGGHWVATRAADIEVIESDYKRFSAHCVSVPKKPESMPRELPQEVDPPVHTALRRPLTAALLPKMIAGMEPRIRALVVELIDGIKPNGKCEFVGDFGKVFPICVFLDLVDLPREDRHYLLPYTDQSVRGRNPETRLAAVTKVRDYLAAVVRERRERPRGDLLSPLVNVEVDGQKIDDEQALSYAALVLFGGLDTVASMLSFVTRFLAVNEAHRRDIILNLGDQDFLRHAVEELLRRHGIASLSRMVTHDLEFGGISLREGDMVMAPNMLVGLDERRVEDPLKVDFRRSPPVAPGIFGMGAHTCPGAVLARRELKMFLEEWLTRIPDFRLARGHVPKTETGLVSAISELHIEWDV